MYFIKASSGIGHQPTFKNSGFSKNLLPLLPNNSPLIRPDYKEYIHPTLLRRMSEILRMSITNACVCLKKAEVDEAGAIIVGTGLGCLFDTEKFLNNAIVIQNSLLPPTSFIQSTHNTLAGQISLITGNHQYNMTHTQNALSFENALLDAMLCLDEGLENILVGAADEYIEQLSPIAAQLGKGDLHLTSGTSFFVLSKNNTAESGAQILDAHVYALSTSIHENITEFLESTGQDLNQIDLVLFSCFKEADKNELHIIFDREKLIDYQKYSGVYATNSAFGLHLAVDIIESKGTELGDFIFPSKAIKNILICNNLNPKNIGLTLVSSCVA